MSVSKRVVEYHIARLSDKNPDVRLKAIRELELIGDPDALEALQALFENDVNVDVRKAAQAAGRAIYKKQREEREGS
ncbi:MAG: hypothetical protein OHK0046_06710 [Anaerolineae bacterium]